MGAMIEVKLTKQRLIFDEKEFQSLMYQHPELWISALQRGKAFGRHEKEAIRDAIKTQGTLAQDSDDRNTRS